MEEIQQTQDTATTPSERAAGGPTAGPALPTFNGNRGLCRLGCPKQSTQLNVYDYFADIPGNAEATDLVEVQFKNTRKGYYHNSTPLPLEKGDVVAVEASPGHDIGTPMTSSAWTARHAPWTSRNSRKPRRANTRR